MAIKNKEEMNKHCLYDNISQKLNRYLFIKCNIAEGIVVRASCEGA